MSGKSLSEIALLIDVNAVCLMTSISRATFFEARASGRFAPEVLRIGRKLLMRRREVEAWIEAGLPPKRSWHWRGGAK